MKFQLVQKNEYGERTIVATSADLDEIIKIGRSKVTEDNIANALALAEKMNEWETCMVEILDDQGNSTNEAVYGGEFRGVPFVYHFRDGEMVKVNLDNVTVPMRFYIGTDNGKDLYASVPSTKNIGRYDQVTELGHRVLEGKGMYYVNIIG